MKNNEYFSNQWKVVLVLAVPVALLMIFGLISSPSSRVIVVFSVAFTLAILFFSRRKSADAIEKYFISETPDILANYFDKTLKNTSGLQDKEVWICYNKSLVYTYYGEFEKALELLSKIEWDNKVPYLQSLELSIKALIHYLNNDNYNEGLRLSVIAQRLGEVSGNYPGAAKSRELFDTYIQIGELLTGNLTQDRIEKLEERFSKFPIFPKILIAWCLSNVYKEMNNNERATIMHEYCKKKVPFCKPLLRVE